MIGHDFLSLYLAEGDGHALVRNALQRVRAGGRCVLQDVPLRRLGGDVFPATVTVEALRAGDGRTHAFAVIIRDRSENAGMEERLRESERRFRLFVNGVPDHAICMLDPHGVILDWNLGAERLTLFHTSEATGKHFRMFFREIERIEEQPERLIAEAAQGGHAEYECDLARRDATLFPACMTLESIRDSDGSLLGFACIIWDATRQRVMEGRIHDAQAETAHWQKVEAIGQLTGGIAHDFNNSLQGIISALEMATIHLECDQAKNAQHYVTMALDAATRAGDLTQRLLGLSRRRTQPSQHVSLPPMLDAIREVLGRVLGDSITLEFAVKADLPQVACDGNQLESAILNLAINARDAMNGKGTLQLKVHGRTSEQTRGVFAHGRAARRYVEISVADHGQGMDADTLRRACEPFFTTKAKDRGTGLGLAMVAGFVAQHGGSMDIQSAVGAGTTVSLFLPCGDDFIMPDRRAAKDVESDIAGLRVLVAENDNAVRSSISARLRQLGCEVHEASDGRQAARMLEDSPSWGLLLSDIDLPELDGYELVREARRQAPTLRAILMTGHADSDLAGSDFADGNTESLIKPFDIGALITKLRLLVGRTR
ncbi:PAS domain-containing hybrid sensor histidine kinase/response regulator [Dyella sp. EPa41]|uniref:response regulator n=1 Tax=Dyella sp. EPa41 TaxID=1561194 RepID=UPI0019167C4D